MCFRAVGTLLKDRRGTVFFLLGIMEQVPEDFGYVKPGP